MKQLTKEQAIAFCENKCYCSDFDGYRPDYRMTDEEEHELVESLRNKE